MADKNMEHSDSNGQVPEVDSPSDEAMQEENDLASFVTEQYRQQADERTADNEEISEERTNNFFERALSESKRMNSEVDKSYKKMADLHAELGADTFASWRAAHAEEVLSPSQIAAVEKASHHTDQL